jgi:hypothetical protein
MLAAILAASAVPYASSQSLSKEKRFFDETWGKPAQAKTISAEQALYLIRSTLLTLNDANRSGNYTVLRDLASPGFQAKNSASDLAQSFSDLRRRNFDLFAVAIMAPQLTVPPAVNQNGLLVLAGYFPTQPKQIRFELLYQVVNKRWRLEAISVATPDAPPAQTPATPKSTGN